MLELTITGWIDDAHVKPVSLVHELRDALGMGLHEAKELLDELAENGEVTIRVESPELFDRLRARLSSIGVTTMATTAGCLKRIAMLDVAPLGADRVCVKDDTQAWLLAPGAPPELLSTNALAMTLLADGSVVFTLESETGAETLVLSIGASGERTQRRGSIGFSSPLHGHLQRSVGLSSFPGHKGFVIGCGVRSGRT